MNNKLESDSVIDEYLALAVKVPIEITLSGVFAGIVVFGATFLTVLFTSIDVPTAGILTVEAGLTTVVYGKRVECTLSGNGPD
jgi:hypothetical protein